MEIYAMKVEPIRDTKDLKTIKKMLKPSARDSALFIIGVNTNLRASDILQITAGQARTAKPGGEFELREKKTGKLRRITWNSSTANAMRRYYAERLERNSRLPDSAPLFVGQRGRLTVPTLSRLVKKWCTAINLEGNFAAHTLRKTWGYHQRKRGVGLPELMYAYNHSRPRQTLDYLGIQPEEITELYMNEII